MKRGFISCGLILYSFICNGETLKWDGQAGDGQWSTELNWSSDRIPGANDEVILDNTFIPGDYIVTLPSGNVLVSLISLTIQPASSTIQCVLPASNIASPALLLSGAGDVFVLHEGAVFRNASGAVTGTPVTVTSNGSFRINDGGHYIHQTGRGHTDFLVSRLSAATGTENGVFEFDVPGTASYTVSVSGRVFGRLIFSAASSGAGRTYTGAGINPVLVRGGLVIRTNATFSYGANTDTITIRGNSLIQPGGVLNIANGSNRAVIRIAGDLDNRGLITETGSSTGSEIFMNGNSAQLVACTGNISQQVTMVVDNEAGLVLDTPLQLPYGLRFRRGKIQSTSSNLLWLRAGAFCTGASPFGFVQGPVKKTGGSSFTFPIGTGEIYSPVSIGDGTADTDEFIAEYKRANPQSTPGLGNNCAYPINHISYVEYWRLDQVTGNTPRQVGLSVSPYSFAYNLEALVVARMSNGQWISEGGVDHIAGVPQLPYITGSFVTIDAVDAFGAITIGSLINQTQNPLPIPVEYFTAKPDNGRVVLNWKTGICPADKIRSELAFSGADRIFIDLVGDHTADTTCNRIYLHTPRAKGLRYYRLKVIDESGGILFSKEIGVMVEQVGLKPEHYVNVIRVDGSRIETITKLAEGNAVFVVIDGAGRTLFFHNYYSDGREQRISIPVYRLSRGLYRVIVMNGKEKLSTAFLK